MYSVGQRGSFRLDPRLGSFGLNKGWVYWTILVDRFGLIPIPIFYNINETAHNDKFSFMTSHTIPCSAAVSRNPTELKQKGDDADCCYL